MTGPKRTTLAPSWQGDRVRALGRLALRFELPLLAIVGVSAALVALYTASISDWVVMTDELLYERLAISIADSFALVPTVHGEHVPVYSQLYPIAIAPFFAVLSMPAAFHAIHVWNPLLMASAAVPAYLLAREVLPGRRLAAYTVAALSVAVPWLVLAGFLLTENAAYPAFLWTVLALQRAVAAPSPRRDLLAIGALVLAFLARTQFVLLAGILPAAVVLHEVGYAIAAPNGRRLDAARVGLRRAFDLHRVAAAAYGAGMLVLAVWALVGSPSDALGSYAGTVEERVLPNGIWRAIPIHIAVLALAIGFLPFVLAGAWALATLWRPHTRWGHAFAVLTLLIVAALSFQVASFDLRTMEPDLVRDRYLFYLAPLLFLGMAACVFEPRRAWLGVLCAGGAFCVAITQAEFPLFDGIRLDAPATAVDHVFTGRALQIGGWVGIDDLRPSRLVAAFGVLATIAVAMALRWVPRRVLAAGAIASTLVYGVAETGYTFKRLAPSMSPSGRTLSGEPTHARAWIDRAVPNARTVGIAPVSIAPTWSPSAVVWWDQEFWNETVNRSYVDRGAFAYTPSTLPAPDLNIDFETGVMDVRSPPQYLVQAISDPRFRPVGRRVARQFGLELLAVEPPFRTAWATRGLDPDGWTRRGRTAVVRVFSYDDVRRVHRLTVTLSAPRVARPRRYALEGGERRESGELGSNRGADADVAVCVPASGYADVRIRVRGSTWIPEVPFSSGNLEGRQVGLRLGPVDAVSTGRGC